jgi:hypothetical protein
LQPLNRIQQLLHLGLQLHDLLCDSVRGHGRRTKQKNQRRNCEQALAKVT